MSLAADQILQAQAAGERAHAALLCCGGVLRPLPAFPDSPYMLAGDEIVWLGDAGASWHPRRILLAKPRQTAVSSRLLVSAEGARVWRPVALPRIAQAQWSAAGVLVGRSIADIGAPAGFGVLLAGGGLRFPLDRASARVRALASALRRDDAAAFEAAALPLLGLGPGLTPSGDDLVGACLFARRLRGVDDCWEAVAQNLTRAAALRSNAISAALFADLARGAAYAPLHDFAAACANAADEGRALIAAARALTAVGHSSGWDMLTGFLLGADARAGQAIDWKAAPDGHFQTLTEFSSVVSSRIMRPAQDVTP